MKEEPVDFFSKLNSAPRMIDFDDTLHYLMVEGYVEVVNSKDLMIGFTSKGEACYNKMKEIADNLTDMEEKNDS